MEVHHHPNVEKKGFKEYVFEFIMIFLAVTMGFFAESLREHMSDRDREQEYMVSLMTDLRNDDVSLQATSLHVSHQIKGLDTLVSVLKQPLENRKNLAMLYIMYFKWVRVYNATSFNNGTIAELKNAGALRTIRNRKIVDKINDYESMKEVVVKNSDEIFRMTSDIDKHEAGLLIDFTTNAKIIDIEESGQRLPSTDSMMRLAEKDTLILLKNDPVFTATFRNSIRSLKSLDQLYAAFLEGVISINASLRNSIKEQYSIE